MAAVAIACVAPASDSDPERLHLHAEADLAAGRADAAAAAFRRLLERDPGDPAALSGLARALLAEGEPEPALAALDQLDARASEPTASADRLHCRVWLAALQARAEADELDGALALAARRDAGGCRSGPTARGRARAQEVRAWKARADGRTEEALAAFRAAAQGPGASAEVFAAAAEILIDQGRYDDAVDWLRSALEVHPRDRRLLGDMVVALSGGLGPRPD